MKNTLMIAVGIMASLSLVAGGAFAGTLGNNITIPDESYTSPSGWYGGPYQEDEEVEPNCLTGQSWDLEGVFFDDISSDLSMVGGFDFINGNPRVRPGDLFIDVTGDAHYGSGLAPNNGGGPLTNYMPYQLVSDTFGYDLVVQFNFVLGTYTVYDIAGQSSLVLQTDSEQQNDDANPWRYISGGTLLATGSINYAPGLADADPTLSGYGLTGGSHNVLTLYNIWPWMAPYWEANGEFTTHYTQECGNDNLMGHFPSVPEPATLSLLGLGLLGAVMRKKFWA